MRARPLISALVLGLLLPLVVTTAPASTAIVSTAGTSSAAVEPGPGSFLTIVSRGKRMSWGIDPREQRLELISATGERRVLLSSRLTRKHGGSMFLADWSADGRTALVQRLRAHGGSDAIAVDLVTGATRTVRLSRDDFTAALLPDGSGLLVMAYATTVRGSQVTRRSWDGTTTPVGRAQSSFLALDATTMITGAPGRRTHALDVVDTTTGSLVRRIETPANGCLPVRTWEGGPGILVSCFRGRGNRGTTLRVVDPTTGAQTKLSLDHPRQRRLGALGDLDARRVASGLYLSVAGPCGVVFVARQEADGTLVPVTSTGPRHGRVLLGTAGDDLLVQHVATCEDRPSTGGILGRLDPVTGVEQRLVELGGREDFAQVRIFGEPRATS